MNAFRGIRDTALWPLQQAVYDRLINDPVLQTMVNDVHDAVPEGAPLPYIEIGDDTVTPYDTKTNYGEDITLTLHTWAEGPGKTETKRIMSALLQAMSKAPLEINGFVFDGINLDFMEVMPDGKVYHGICRFRVYIKQ